MDNFFKNQLYIWTYEKIKSNPKKFGGDFSNSLIMYEYLKEFYNDFAVFAVKPEEGSDSFEAISACKSLS